MTKPKQIEVPVAGDIDLATAEALATRVRAAMRNEIPHIVLVLSHDAALTSAEFLSFLSASASFMRSENRRISIRGANEKNQALLRIAKLDQLLEEE